MTKNSDICRVLYTSLPDNYFKYKYCGTVRRQQHSSGYGNLISHLRAKHPQYETDYVAHTSSLAANLQSFGFVSDKIANIYHWMEWVVDRNMPLSEIDHLLTRSMFRLKLISSKTLRKYLSVATMAVKKVIAANMPPEVGIMFNAWQCLSGHYVALIAMYCRNDEMIYGLLALAPLDEADQSSESYCSFLRNILPIFGQSEESLKVLVGDNCATNQRMATLLGVPLVGVRPIVQFGVQSGFVRTRGPGDGCGHARDGTTDCQESRGAQSAFATCSSSCQYDTLELDFYDAGTVRANQRRYQARGCCLQSDPKPVMHRRIVALFEMLKTFSSICKKLQVESLTMVSARVLFDKMAEMYSVTAAYLSPDANIVHSPALESAVVKRNSWKSWSRLKLRLRQKTLPPPTVAVDPEPERITARTLRQHCCRLTASLLLQLYSTALCRKPYHRQQQLREVLLTVQAGDDTTALIAPPREL
ncbi:hypothetical protein PHMEG_00035274 [Phytophthora megakarya]|uniref:Uncharacterized protein n=1 Tax=Phytophthora megakarya TaxID=4795 RepID=A0A225UP47_9STRA|nr:hypothetical protein PHMEG_00035274 [Phytophthora megakarya]